MQIKYFIIFFLIIWLISYRENFNDTPSPRVIPYQCTNTHEEGDRCYDQNYNVVECGDGSIGSPCLCSWTPGEIKCDGKCYRI